MHKSYFCSVFLTYRLLPSLLTLQINRQSLSPNHPPDAPQNMLTNIHKPINKYSILQKNPFRPFYLHKPTVRELSSQREREKERQREQTVAGTYKRIATESICDEKRERARENKRESYLMANFEFSKLENVSVVSFNNSNNLTPPSHTP